MFLHDAVIPFHPKDSLTIDLCCRQLKNILGIKRIFLISWENPNISGTEFINENSLNLVPYNYIKSIWEKPERTIWNTGWIYQQLLKLAANTYISDLSDNYLICDSDIFFVNNPYKNIENSILPYSKNYLHTVHKVNVNSYRYIYKDLLKENPKSGFSFINHHMIFNKQKIIELQNTIENLQQKKWDYSIVDLLNFEHSFTNNKSFSEYDLYGNWIFSRYPNEIKEIILKVKDIDYIPTEHELNNCNHHDIISSQAWVRCSSNIL